MPDPTRLLRTVQQAIDAFRLTPGRKGHLVNLQEVEDVFVVGDLHGNLENFRKVLELAELAKQPRRHLVFQELIHGPHRYPAGGEKSHQLVDLLTALKCQYPSRVHFLLGNHEMAQLTAQTISKDDALLNGLFREGVGTAYGPQAAAVYAAYQRLFLAAPVALRTPNRVFLSHSLPSARRLATFDPLALELDEPPDSEYRAGGSIHALLWGRDTSAANVAAFLEKVGADWLITGHIPCPQGYATPNDRQLILDALGSPACACCFPVDRPMTLADLINGIIFLS